MFMDRASWTMTAAFVSRNTHVSLALSKVSYVGSFGMCVTRQSAGGPTLMSLVQLGDGLHPCETVSL